MNQESRMKRREKTNKENRDFSIHDSSFVIHNSARPRALVVGSVAFDVLFGVHGTIQDRIVLKKGKLGKQNLMFTAQAKEERYGGTGANIAYGLGLLGVQPILFSSVGQDFKHRFQGHLADHGVDVQVHVEEQAWTATFYGMSDEAKEQIGVWQPNAHETLEKISIIEKLGINNLREVSVAIFSGALSSTYPHMREIRNLLGKEVCIIFDPGKMILSGEEALLKKGLKLADILIVNDVELHQVEAFLGCSVKEILKMGPNAVIETKGESGSIIHEENGRTQIKAVKPKKVVETTGAGDAYRAGLMYGLLNGMDLAAACMIGAKLGAKNVETVGGQAYQVDLKNVEI